MSEENDTVMKTAMQEAQNKKTQKDAKSLGPAIPKLGTLKSPEEMKAVVEAAQKRREEIRVFLAGLPEEIQKALDGIRDCAGTQMADGYYRKWLEDNVFQVADENVREQARWVFAETYVADAIQKGVMFNEVKDRLMELSLVRELQDGQKSQIRLDFGRFTLAPGTYPQGMRSTVESVFKQLFKLYEETGEQRKRNLEEEEKKFMEGASLSWTDLLQGKEGVYVVSVPSVLARDKDREVIMVERDGRKVPKRHQGGKIKVKVASGRVTALGAFSHAISFRNWLTDACMTEATIQVEEIKRERIGRRDRLSEMERRAVFSFHTALRRSYYSHQEREDRKEVAEKAKSQATVDYLAFLLSFAVGIAFIKIKHFQWGKRHFNHLWMLVKRDDEGITVLEVSDENFLSKTFLNTPFKEGGNFELDGVPEQLGKFLRYAASKAKYRQERGQTEESGSDEEAVEASE